MEYNDGYIYIKYPMGNKTGKTIKKCMRMKMFLATWLALHFCVYNSVFLPFKQAGFTSGIILILLMGILTLYCCYRVVKSRKTIRKRYKAS